MRASALRFARCSGRLRHDPADRPGRASWPRRPPSTEAPAEQERPHAAGRRTRVVYDSEAKSVSAVGHVEIVDDGRTLQAERVDYDQAKDQVTARGHVSITDDKGNVVFADHVVLTDHMRDGALSGFGALLGKTGRLAATSAQRVNATTVIAHRTV